MSNEELESRESELKIRKGEDEKYMRYAIELAKRGMGFTAPNPMVGAVIVSGGAVVGEGWHHRCGELHAEREAFADMAARAAGDAAGATMYVTLEPCCHQGRTPPCTDAIIEHGVARVVIGSPDPNPLVAGGGVRRLRDAGIEVTEYVLQDECEALNPEFFHYVTTGLPYIVMKFAETLDGKIASHTGASRWITGPKARQHVHEQRARYAAILVGIGTVLADDPMLNCRLPGAHQPLRIILDSKLRIPLGSQIVQSTKEYPTLAVFAKKDDEKEKALQDAGVELLFMPELKTGGSLNPEPKVDIAALFHELGKRGISSVLVEGGGDIHEAVLRTGLVNHVMAYIAPLLMGGRDAKSPVEGLGADSPDSGTHLKNRRVTILDEDILLEFDT